MFLIGRQRPAPEEALTICAWCVWRAGDSLSKMLEISRITTGSRKNTFISPCSLTDGVFGQDSLLGAASNQGRPNRMTQADGSASGATDSCTDNP